MSLRMTGLAALIVLAGLSGSARAQNYTTYSTPGFGYGYSGGYGNYALPVQNPYYGGYGPAGVVPRGYARNYYGRPSTNLNVPQTYNNMGGLTNIIRQQTGRSNSYRRGPNAGANRVSRGF